MFQDEILKCSVCGGKFVFSAEEQEFYSSKGFTSKPSKCKECRKQRSDNHFKQMLVDPSLRKECRCKVCGKTYLLPRQLAEAEMRRPDPLPLVDHCPVCMRQLYEQAGLGDVIILNQALQYPR